MASMRDLAIVSLSAAAGAVAAVAAQRFLSSYTATNGKSQNPPRGEPLAVNGSTAGSPPAKDHYKVTKREGLVLVVRPSLFHYPSPPPVAWLPLLLSTSQDLCLCALVNLLQVYLMG
jgi:hypothetical protein